MKAIIYFKNTKIELEGDADNVTEAVKKIMESQEEASPFLETIKPTGHTIDFPTWPNHPWTYRPGPPEENYND